MPRDPAVTELADGRQVAPSQQGIKQNHRERYWWAITKLREYAPNPGIVLDAACGVGYGTFLIGQSGYDAIGFDISTQALEYANQHYRTQMASFRRGQLGSPELELPSAEAVVSIETIEHVEDAPALLAQFKAAAPILITSVPNEVGVPYNPDIHIHHFRHYTQQEFETLLNEAGYEVIEWAHQEDKFRTGGRVFDGPGGICLMVVAVLKEDQ